MRAVGLFASGRRAGVAEGTAMGDSGVAADGVSGRLRYRRQVPVGRRARRGVIRYSEAEWAVIVQVAGAAGLRPGAWVQQAAYEAAVRLHRGHQLERGVIDGLVEELRQHRRVLTNIGGNLNDLARAANATGASGNAGALGVVLRLVRNAVLSSDELVRRVRVELLG